MRGKVGGINFWVIAFFLLYLAVSAEAQEKKPAAKVEEKKPAAGMGFGLTASDTPIDITSDFVEANQKQNTVLFKGNVVAKQEAATVFTNTLTVYYDNTTKKLREIVANGNVKVVLEDRTATSQKANFFPEQNKVVLEGDAVLREGENVVRGERVTLYLDEERYVVEPPKGGRVSTTVTPPKK